MIITSIYRTYSHAGYETMSLGSLHGCGYVGVQVRFDREPARIKLISPSGKTFNSDVCDVNEIDMNSHTQTVLNDFTEDGEYFVMIDKKSNKALAYDLVQKPSHVLHIDNPEINDLESGSTLSFTPVMDSAFSTCHYSLTLKSEKRSFSMSDDSILMNVRAVIAIKLPENAYDGSTYDMRLAVSTEDGGSDGVNLKIILPKKTLEISESTSEPNTE